MAIVFPSIEKKQKAFNAIMVVLLALILFGIPFLIFSPWLDSKINNTVKETDYRPNLDINFTILDSDQVKNLESFPVIETEFSYTGQDKKGKKIQGLILAMSKEDAQIMLEKTGITILSLEESSTGRNDPFAPFDQVEKNAIVK